MKKFKIQVIGNIWSGGKATYEQTFDLPEAPNAQRISVVGDFQSIDDFQVIKIESEIIHITRQSRPATQFIHTETIVREWASADSKELFAQMTYSD